MSERVPIAGRDAWDIVLERLSRRWLFRVALAVLALVYASAIYAPLLANDRPYLLEAVDFRAYGEARRVLGPATEELAALLASGASGRILGDQAQAVTSRARTLERYLPGPEAGRVREFRAAVETQVASGADASELAARARSLAAALVPIQVGKPGGAVELVPARSFPLFAALGGADVGFMVLWACVLAFPLWNRIVDRRWLGGDPARIRAARRTKVAVVLALALACGALWQARPAGATAFHASSFKDDLTRGDLRATRVLFPPLALGYAETHLDEVFRPPTWTAAGAAASEAVAVRSGEPAASAPLRHPLGTDGLGRDGLARLIWGGRVSLAVGVVSTALLMAIGILVGGLAGYCGGRTDLLISRAIDVVLCFPVFFLILVVVAFLGPSVLTIMLVIGALRWTSVARLARGEFLRLRELDFVVAARALGLSHARILLRHVLPNAAGPLLVAASFSLASGILIESSLSFLRFGIQDPIPSWGALINESQKVDHWWVHVFPGLLIFLTVLCTNLVGDAVRDALDPRHEVPPKAEVDR
jgi:peptide/nickel transport system permease protein